MFAVSGLENIYVSAIIVGLIISVFAFISTYNKFTNFNYDVKPFNILIITLLLLGFLFAIIGFPMIISKFIQSNSHLTELYKSFMREALQANMSAAPSLSGDSTTINADRVIPEVRAAV